MRILLAVLITALTAQAATAQAETPCPDGQTHEVLKQLIHQSEVKYEEYVRDVIVFENHEYISTPAKYKFIPKTDDYIHPDFLTYEYVVFTPAKYETVEVPGEQNYDIYNILLKLDGSYAIIDEIPDNQRPPVYDRVMVTPKRTVTHEKTIPMPPPVEENGQLRILVAPATMYQADTPDVVKKETRRRIKSRKPAILREVLGECR